MTRSFLFVPGYSERKLSKVSDTRADAVILDLEDSVRPDLKASARERICALLSQTREAHGPELWVRINPMDSSEFLLDLRAIVPARPVGLVVPKTGSLDSINRLGAHLDNEESRAEMELGSTRIIPIFGETAASVLNAATYAAGHPRLAGFTWGIEDLSTALGMRRVAESAALNDVQRLARSLCLLAASAAGIPAFETVFANIADPDGLKASSIESKDIGFQGRLAIHPSQVSIINDAFSTTVAEREAARRIVDAFENAASDGAIQLDGQMLDRPHLQAAQALLKKRL